MPDTTSGKHVRCSGCGEIVHALAEAASEVLPPPRPRQVAPPPLPAPESPEQEVSAEPETFAVPGAVAGLRCASCEAEAVVELPPDANSRKPGYICAMCRTVMRPVGSRANYYAAVLLGALVVLLGVGLVVVALKARLHRSQLVGGGASLAVLGLVVAGWSFMQARLPVPHGGQPPPTRVGFWLAILAVALLLAGGGAYGLLYVMHEMS